MLEKFKDFVSAAIEKQNEQLMTFNLDTVQGYFEMQDLNKMLKFNAISKEQIKRCNSFEEHFQNIIKNLYVPTLQTENV